MCGVKPPDQRRQKVSGCVGRDLSFSPTQSLQVMRWHWPQWPRWLQCPQINMIHQTSSLPPPSPPQSPPPLRKILKMFIVFVLNHNFTQYLRWINLKNTYTQEWQSLKEKVPWFLKIKIILRDRNFCFAFICSVRGNFHTTSQCVLTTVTSSMMNNISAGSLFYKHPSQ